MKLFLALLGALLLVQVNCDNIDRIYQGWHLSPHEFPWMVKLKATFPSNTEPGKFKRRICGGALINDQWVLTARHCVTWHPPNLPGHRLHEAGKGISAVHMKVYLGSHASYGEDGQEIVAQVAIGREDYGKAQCSFKKRSNAPGGADLCISARQPRHLAPFSLFEAIFGRFRRKRRNYPISKRQGLLEKAISVGKDITFTNDIALVKLSHKVNFSDKIQPVRLPKNTFNYQGYQCYVTGWGIQGPFEGPSASLKGAELVIVDGSREKGCSAQTGWGKLCAVSLDNFNGQAGSACPGDSGAPLVTFDTKNGGWTLIGLLSNGAKSCFKGLPEVYTKVGDYLDWIYKTMNENSVP